MTSVTGPRRRIVFVPGKNPKPHWREHRAQVWRCLLEGVRRADPGLVGALAESEDCFEIISWNHLFYGEYKSMENDLPWIDALIHQPGPTAQDRWLADHWHIRTARLFYTIADHLPFLIPLIPSRAIRASMRETARYFQNRDEIADRIRELLKERLRDMFAQNERVLLIGHSMGSVIAYDSLWELWHGEGNPGRVALLLTLGSPLAMEYVRRRLLGAGAGSARRYPGNIRRWINIAAVGDLTALDRGVSDDYGEMAERGFTESIQDIYRDVYNHFRNEEGLNVHRSYGYLVNPRVGRVIADWWQDESAAPDGR
jgi:pimeloyl-ACP methyl ester carboxylesterase